MNGTDGGFDRGSVFAPRRVWCGGVRTYADWRLRYYVILADAMSFDADSQRCGLGDALSLLPSPAVSEARPGVGFVICHAGVERAYVVLNFWDNQNELFQRIVIAEQSERIWRNADGNASFCVWDTDVIAHERQTYIEFVLAPPDGPNLEAYLNAAFAPSSDACGEALTIMPADASFEEAWPGLG